ncbi:hypothetical protein LARI1_G006596 [Lachnellula arida]|uniref:Apple domain-containing protein n=1 Tax=Lachnellula arida TaxID=1316785 RepID=A0A8T9B8S1_9HELO|nr:hypothetical protein LARI1_G006596 [Lachnellula arida]
MQFCLGFLAPSVLCTASALKHFGIWLCAFNRIPDSQSQSLLLQTNAIALAGDMDMAAPYSDLEMVPSCDPQVTLSSGLEYYINYFPAGLELDTSKASSTAHLHSDNDNEARNSPSTQHRRVCGLALRTFWTIVAVGIVVVIGAAVGGSVGGSLASKSSSVAASSSPNLGSLVQASTTSAASSGQSTNSTIPSLTISESSMQPSTTFAASSDQSTTLTTPSLTSTQVALTTTQIIGPSYTLLRDCPSSNNTLYGITLGPTTMNFRKVCGRTYPNILGASNENLVNQKTSSLDSCINLCASYNVKSASAIASGQSLVCNAVCWRNSLDHDDYPGNCFGFTTQNSSSAFVVDDEANCDSAAWIDQRIL